MDSTQIKALLKEIAEEQVFLRHQKPLSEQEKWSNKGYDLALQWVGFKLVEPLLGKLPEGMTVKVHRITGEPSYVKEVSHE